MFDNINEQMSVDFIPFLNDLKSNPFHIVTLILDIVIVGFLIYELVKFMKNTRVWQLIKGIAFLVIATLLSEWLNLKILYFILSTIMTYGVIALLIIFQPELRRGLEQLGSNAGTFAKLFGIPNKEEKDKTKEDIYKIVIAVEEMSKSHTGALIVFERDIKLKDIIDTGIIIDSQISPQLICNIFVPNTPLHDGAIIVSNNRIASAACILPLANDKDIAKELGTRHRAAIGISKDSDAISVVVSEETGKVSIAKDGTLIADISEDALKRILLKQLIVTKYKETKEHKRLNKIKEKISHKKIAEENLKNDGDKDE